MLLGGGDHLLEPDSDSSEFDEAHEVGEQLVVSGRDAPELFELVEEALDDVALLVQVGVVGTLTVRLRFGGMTTSLPVCAILSQR